MHFRHMPPLSDSIIFEVIGVGRRAPGVEASGLLGMGALLTAPYKMSPQNNEIQLSVHIKGFSSILFVPCGMVAKIE